jgi:hypothetical protein
MHTFRPEYFNLSLNLQEWELVICDANSMSHAPNYPFIQAHLEAGGKLIMRDFNFRYPGFPLFHYLGFDGRGEDERIIDGPPEVYLWDTFHSVFNRPVDYGETYVNASVNHFYTDWTSVMLFDNATALAGLTPTSEENMSAIILSDNGQALCNMFSISQYYEDTDDSTYPDNFELWLNEIAYMMRPTIDSPGDLVFEIQGPESEFAWDAHSYAPGDYQLWRDDVLIYTGFVWDGSPVVVNIAGLSLGTYEYHLMVRDHVGYRTDDYINVTIEDHMAPDWIVQPSNEILEYGDPFSQQLSASDPSGIGGWYIDDYENFTITLDGLLTNNTILEIGDYNLTVSVEDSLANIRDYEITISVVLPTTTTTSTMMTETISSTTSSSTTVTTDTTTHTTSEPTTSTTTAGPAGDPTIIIIVLVAAGVVVIIIIIILMKKRGG